MSQVFLDTVGLLARWDRRDQWHQGAKAAFMRLMKSGAEFVTTTYVLLECGNAAARRPYRSAVDWLRISLEAEGALIVPSDGDWDAAWEAYANRESGEAGIVDCVSFTVMRRLEIKQVFSNDVHFRAAGFETLF